MHRSPAGLPFGIPGIGDVMEGAVQQAPQPIRHSIILELFITQIYLEVLRECILA